MAPGLEQYVVPASLLILIALFSRQSRGRLVRPRHGRVVRVMAIGGLLHILDDPSILEAISPVYGISFLLTHGTAGLLALGAAFLSVTGAEALYADTDISEGARPACLARSRSAFSGIELRRARCLAAG